MRVGHWMMTSVRSSVALLRSPIPHTPLGESVNSGLELIFTGCPMCGSMTVLLPKVVIGGRIENVCQVKCVCFCAVLKETCICILWVEVLTPGQELIFTGAVQSICTGVKNQCHAHVDHSRLGAV